MRTSTLVTLFFAGIAATSHSAEITWGAPFVITEAADVSNPDNGNLVVAADFNNATGTAQGDDNMINGIEFTESGPGGIGDLAAAMGSGSNYNAAWFTGATDDPDLDALLDSHAWQGGNPGTTSFTLNNLVAGSSYQVQLIAVADARGCCAGRTYEPDDGQGNYTTGVMLQRGLFQSVIGTFTADSATQEIGWRSLNDATGNNDPGLSGMVAFQINNDDSDGDGLFDAWEELYGLNPNSGDSDNDGTPDDEENDDGDLLDNGAEQSAGTNPTLADTDGDGYDDHQEDGTGEWMGVNATGTNPLLKDSDGDGLDDGVENPDLPFVDADQTGSDPNKVDTDEDMLPDDVEVALMLNPNATDTDGNGILDGDEDEDMDGSGNAAELANGTGISDEDSDDDGLLDGVETNTGSFVRAGDTGTNPLDADSDNDTITDGDEVNGENGFVTVPTRRDTDRDGVPDDAEIAAATDPTNPSSRPALDEVAEVPGLLGGDLTDADDDGAEGPTDLGPPQTAGTGFDWLSIAASGEEYFHNQTGVGEGAFDIFDNTVGRGGAKWCCGGPPQTATVEFGEPVSITHFTITSGNDVPARDPLSWQILGSEDGVTFTPIYTRTDAVSLWTGRNQTMRFVLPAPSNAYQFIRYEVTGTGGTEHQINEIEYFGDVGEQAELEITNFAYNHADGEASLTWASRPGRTYSIFLSFDGVEWGTDVTDDVESQGESTTYGFTNPEFGQGTVIFRVVENG